MEDLMTKGQARAPFKVGKTKFAEDILPRLVKVHVGPRSVRVTRSSVERVMGEIIAESAEVAAAAPPVPVNKRKPQRLAS